MFPYDKIIFEIFRKLREFKVEGEIFRKLFFAICVAFPPFISANLISITSVCGSLNFVLLQFVGKSNTKILIFKRRN